VAVSETSAAPFPDARPGCDPGPWSDAVVVSLQAWITARIVVVTALAFSHYLVDHLGRVQTASLNAVHAGLLAWDGAWYSDIASKGYAALPQEALRFFPALPLSARFLGATGIGERPALVGIANLSAFLAGVVLYRLIRWERGDRALAERAVWLLAIAPPAFVFVMGYTDATTVALAVATMYALRRHRWGWATAFALAAGLCRPTAFLLVVPAAIEANRAIDDAPWRERLARIAAIVAAPVGTFLYLTWVGFRFGDLLLPFRVQTSANLRGHFTDPVTALYRAADGITHDHIGSALHVPWFVVIVALTVVVCRRWPLAYGAFAVVVVASSVTSNNLDSQERYALLAFPLVIAAAELTRSRRIERIVFVLAPVAMFGYATLAFLGLIGP
jgi:hypothetical protein